MEKAKWQAVAAALGIAVLAWLSYGRVQSVPLLSHVDQAIGDMVRWMMAPLSAGAIASAATIAQLLVPLALAVFLLQSRRESSSAGLALAWSGTAWRDASTRIATPSLSQLVWVVGLLLLAAALALSLAPLFRDLRGQSHDSPMRFVR